MSPYAAVLVLVGLSWSVQDGDPMDRLVAELGDESVAVRESALQSLIASGPKAKAHLREALQSRDAEVQQRATCALVQLELAEKLAGVLQACPPVTLSLRDVPFAQALTEVARRTGMRFEGVVGAPGRTVTATFTRAPLMQVLDVLATTAGLRWSFDSDATVCWRREPPASRPSSYFGGFKTSLSRIDMYKSWDFDQGHGILWIYLETQMEPGIRPVGLPRFEVSQILDESGNEMSRDAETRGCLPKLHCQEGVGRKSGAIYESSPFTINPLHRSVKKLSRVGGRAVFLFPVGKAPLEIHDLCENSSVTQGDLDFRVNEILTSSLKLTLVSNGNVAHLPHHVDPDSLVLIDAEGREYGRGTSFDVRVDEMGVDTLRYCVDFHEDVCFQPVAVRFLVTTEFFEKVVPFVFVDVPLP